MQNRDWNRERLWRETDNDWDWDYYYEYRYVPSSPYRGNIYDRNYYGRDREYDRDFYSRDYGYDYGTYPCCTSILFP